MQGCPAPHSLVQASDILPLLLLPQLIGLQLQVSDQLHGRHLPTTTYCHYLGIDRHCPLV